MVLFGGNDEGIRSAARLLEPLVDGVETRHVKHHARVLAGARRTRIEGLKARLADWRRLGQIELQGVTIDWVSYPGVFAKGGLDQGTALLLRHMPAIAAGQRVLDFAAGTGVIARAVQMAAPGATVEMVEADAVALEAARENVPGADFVCGDGLDAVSGRFDVIVSNPPVHEGVAESRAVVERLIAEAPGKLVAGGELRLVVLRHIGVVEPVARAFGAAESVADDGRFVVVRGVKARGKRG
jgi:16S rRNA (guanine1207-N2)-methyltransferase